MIMKYRLHKVTNHTQKSFGKYVAKAVHSNTVSAKEIELEIQNNCSAKRSDCEAVLCELADCLKRHLQAGEKVELPYLGTVKLEIDSIAVDNEEDFNASQHIKGVKLHLLSKTGKSGIDYHEGLEFTKE